MRGMDDITFTDWRKSSLSFSNGNCVEVGTAWRKSSRSNASNCVETASCRHGVAIRDSKDSDGPVLAFDGSTWGRFVAGLKAPAVA